MRKYATTLLKYKQRLFDCKLFNLVEYYYYTQKSGTSIRKLQKRFHFTLLRNFPYLFKWIY